MSVLDPTYLGDIYSGGIPTAGTTLADTAQASTAQVGAGPSTDAITSSILKALSPQFDQQNRAQTEALANAGIVGGSSVGAAGALGDQQQTQALSAMAPYIIQGYSMQEARDLANQQALNAGAQFNAGAQNAQNDVNAGASNATDQFNTSNQLKAGEFDASNANAASGELASIQNQDYLAQFGAQANQIAQGSAGATGAYQPVYTQPSPVNYGGFASAISSGFAPQATATQQSTTGGASGTAPATPTSTMNPYGNTGINA